MTFTEAAAEVLRLAGKPLHYKEITEIAIEKNLLSHVGKSPEVTMGARLAALLKKDDDSVPIIRIKPGVFGLREWDKKSVTADEAADDGNEVNALEVAALGDRSSSLGDDEPEPEPEDGDETVVSGDDAERAALAASGAELFDDEEDDDQPILGGAPPSASGTPGSPTEGQAEGGRRRRRRRRRGRGGQGDGLQMQNNNGAPAAEGDVAITEMRDPLAPSPRPLIRDRHQIMAGGAPSGIDVPLGEGDELAGRELADATLIVFGAFDRGGGPVALRSLVDQLMRRGRLSGDPTMASVQLSASLRADNLRRQGMGVRPRFRFASGGRVAPTDWLLGQDFVRYEQEVQMALDRYRDTARRVFLRRIQELPGHAFIELALLGLERIGMANIKTVRRAGSSGGEAHFAAVHRTGSDEIRTAIVVRKDGREIGRERVSDLRGALHHYGPANAGWLISTGQVLSGAREEAAAQNAPPIALYDGVAFCKLLEENDVGVVRSRIHVAIPDLELLETLRG